MFLSRLLEPKASFLPPSYLYANYKQLRLPLYFCTNITPHVIRTPSERPFVMVRLKLVSRETDPPISIPLALITVMRKSWTFTLLGAQRYGLCYQKSGVESPTWTSLQVSIMLKRCWRREEPGLLERLGQSKAQCTVSWLARLHGNVLQVPTLTLPHAVRLVSSSPLYSLL